MNHEIAMLEKAGTWITIPQPANKNIVGSKWVFQIKCKADGSIKKYKAWLVTQTFTQKYSVNYFDTFLSLLTSLVSKSSLLSPLAMIGKPIHSTLMMLTSTENQMTKISI